MKIREKLLYPYRQELICDCGNVAEFTGHRVSGTPAFYMHRCTGCGEEIKVKGQYPKIVHKVARAVNFQRSEAELPPHKIHGGNE